MSASAPAVPWTADRRLLAALALAGALASVYMMRNADPDLWGHLRYGRLFVEQRGLPNADPFAFTSAGRQWSSHEYLAQVLLWLAYAAGGPAGLVVLKCLVGGGSVWFLYRAMRLASDDPRVWAPALLLSAHVLGRWFIFRPQLFTFLLLAIFVHTLLGHLLGRAARLWLLPLLTASWVNLHGGFLAGIGAVGLSLGLRLLQCWQQAPPGTPLRGRLGLTTRGGLPLAVCLALCLAATLLNPLGWRLWPYLATELTCDVNRRFIEEWQPLSFAEHGWTAATFWVLVGLLVAAALAAGGQAGRVAGLAPWQWLLSCLPLALMASRSVRHVPVFALWAGPVLALLAQAAWGPPGGRGPWRRLWPVAAAVALLPTALTIRFVVEHPSPSVATSGPVLGACSPCGAVAFMRANGLRGRVFNPLWWGSYLTWELYPDVRVSMDGRNVTLFPPALVAENLSFYLADDPPAGAALDHGADFVLVPADAPVLTQLRGDSRWVILFDDGQAALFARAGAAPSGLRRAAPAPAGPDLGWDALRPRE
jgi:hypothetical protein